MTRKMTDQRLELLVSKLLRTGVLLSGTLVLAGGVYYLSRQGKELVEYRHFQGVPVIDRAIGSILQGALTLRPRSVIQLGVLTLIATPIARVALSLVGFAFEHDRV